MGHTPEQRSGNALCNSRKKDGSTCRAFAGQGTDHPGVGRCKFHGGSTPNGRKNAASIEARAKMVQLGAPIDGIKPHEALLGVLRATAGHVAWLHQEIATLDDLEDHDARVLVELYGTERDRLTRIAEACLKGGVSEDEVRVTQETARVLSLAIDNAVTAVGGWTAKQRRAFGEALRLELAMAADDATDGDRPGAPGGLYRAHG
jgi:hypothetical protein